MSSTRPPGWADVALPGLRPPEDPTWLGTPRGEWPTGDETNPFLRYRSLLDSHRRAMALGWSDDQFVDLVGELDDAVRSVDDVGFVITPVTDDRTLAEALGHRAALFLKDETHNVAGSHKARHLFGLALHLAVEGVPTDRELAISSCGNAALAAAVTARAAGRTLTVFVPTWADDSVVGRLHELDAHVRVCRREPGEVGDPCYRRFEEAVRAGAVAFGCQGPAEPRTLDGGRTLGWELADQVPEPDRLVIHVGGGALGSSLVQGLAGAVALGRWEQLPRFDTAQTAGCAPLAAALGRMREGLDDPSTRPDDPWANLDLASMMQPWPEEPQSVADGILDDVTYDWLVLAWAMLGTGGEAVVVPEDLVVAAHQASAGAGWRASPTGTAGLAGLLASPDPEADTVVVMSGIAR